MVAAAAALCLLMSLSGMSLLLSREAVPGDPLYTFKRSAESAELGLTFGDEGKALKHLEFANARVSEIEAMAGQSDSRGSWLSGEDRFLRALNDFDVDTIAGTRLLTEAVADGEVGALSPMRGWADQQRFRLQAVRSALPLPASTRLDSTVELLDRVIGRVTALNQRSTCRSIVSGAHDDLGALPARNTCTPIQPDDTSTVEPLPAEAAVPELEPADSLVPPGLLTPAPSASPAPQPGRVGDLELPTGPDGVLPDPSAPGPTRPAPSPIPGDGSSPPSGLPMPLPLGGIPLFPFVVPDGDPHVE